MVKYMLHLNGYDKARAHLVHLYVQHGINYDQAKKPPSKQKDNKATNLPKRVWPFLHQTNISFR